MGLKEPLEEMKLKQRVTTANPLGDTTMLLVGWEYLDARRPGMLGVVEGQVSGHRGEVWKVRHVHGVAAYHRSELNEPGGFKHG